MQNGYCATLILCKICREPAKKTRPMDRADIVHDNFLARVAARDFPHGKPASGPLTGIDAVTIFRAACTSRALDRTSRAMQRAGTGFYTIGSSGHEGMAAVAMALRPTDMAFLHYRDAAFQIAISVGRKALATAAIPSWPDDPMV